ncbi:MAG: hypothetical protein ACREBF_01480 [Candidatus Micrarchaeales archaeon]
MPQVTKEWVLSELKRPIPAGQSVTTDVLRDRLGIPRNSANNEYQELCKTVEELKADGLVSINADDEQRIRDYGGRGDLFLYENATIGYHLRLTSNGELWLAQMNRSRQVERIQSDVNTMSNNTAHIASNNRAQIGIVNIEKLFDFSGGKFKFNILGRNGSIEDQQLGVILMVLEIGIGGISMQYIKWNMTDSWILAIVLILTVIIFNGKKAVKKLQNKP